MVKKPDEETPETPEETPETEEEPEKETPETPEKEDKKIEPGKKEEEPEEPEGEPKGKPEEIKRTPRLMEVYKHEIALKKFAKEKEDLQSQVLDLTRKLEDKSKPDRTEIIKKFGEKMGWEEDLIGEFSKLFSSPDTSKFETELAGLKKEITKDREARIWEQEDRAFEQDFDKNIKPLLETEQLSDEAKSRVKKLLKTYAFTPEYAKTPLPVIYKGLDEFREIGTKGKKSGETARGGLRAKEGEVSVLDMKDDEFNAYIDEEKKKAGKFLIRRDGRAIS